MMNKNVQIPEKLLTDMYRFILLIDSVELDADTKALSKSIETQIGAKIEAMERRQLYTKSKTGETPEEREQARQTYLDGRGVHPDFRY